MTTGNVVPIAGRAWLAQAQARLAAHAACSTPALQLLAVDREVQRVRNHIADLVDDAFAAFVPPTDWSDFELDVDGALHLYDVGPTFALDDFICVVFDALLALVGASSITFHAHGDARECACPSHRRGE